MHTKYGGLISLLFRLMEKLLLKISDLFLHTIFRHKEYFRCPKKKKKGLASVVAWRAGFRMSQMNLT